MSNASDARSGGPSGPAKPKAAPKKPKGGQHKRPKRGSKPQDPRANPMTTFQMIVGLVGIVVLLAGAALTGELKTWRVTDG